MKCTNIPDSIGPVSINHNFPHIKHAGENVGIDLEKPIDPSKMQVMAISMDTHDDGYRLQFIRESTLRTFIINDLGEEEELTITFSLKSQRRAKFSKIEK